MGNLSKGKFTIMSALLTISYGDTLDGPAMLETALGLLAEAGAALEIETVQLGAPMVKLGFEKGYDDEALTKIRRAGVLLKAPTNEDVTKNLREELGDEIVIFEPDSLTLKAMVDATLAMLRHLEQNDVVERILIGH